MNKQTLILVGAVLIIGVGAWLILSQGTDESRDSYQSESASQSDRATTENENINGFGSFASLMGMGKNLTCDFSSAAGDGYGPSSGTVYIAGERMRGDFTSEQDGTTAQTHMIHDGDSVYTWSKSAEGTFAMKFHQGEVDVEQDAGVATMPSQAMSIENDVDYDCHRWSVDGSKFVPPSDIEFMDMEAMMGGEMPPGMPF